MTRPVPSHQIILSRSARLVRNPYPDVIPALTALRAAGFMLVTLTNSARSPSPTPLEKAGIDTFFDHHFSIDDVGRFKPDPAPYKMVAEHLKVNTTEMCMVACHLWDTIGAQSVGCQGAFIRQRRRSYFKCNAMHIEAGRAEFQDCWGAGPADFFRITSSEQSVSS